MVFKRELEKQIAELQHKVDTLQGFLDHDIEYDMDKTIQELRKENAELKKRLVFARAEFQRQYKENEELKAKNKWYSEQVCNKECAEVWGNLTKAKEIIRTFLNMPMPNNEEVFADVGIFLTKAEQFLKEDVGTKNYEEQDKILKTRLL